ncbi:hypothetical protein PanWU01x14_104770 [Parasponia andersonii]|uniref:RNase H type-1 domain-containing protein n=1 Tax=Parasponia andersonii TaxID=3476 RepID=A0A2P5D1X9_PARAD|nr:hypothetical protein PanWU01x14_104770 [Parasponia andersonii]
MAASPCSEVLVFSSVALEAIWKTRNEAVHNNSSPWLHRLILTIASSMSNFGQPFTKFPTHSGSHTWHPPLEDWCKINFDTALWENSSVRAAIYHNSSSSVLGITTKIHPPVSPIVSEYLAAKFAIELIISLNIFHVVFAGNSTRVVQSLTWDLSNVARKYQTWFLTAAYSFKESQFGLLRILLENLIS